MQFTTYMVGAGAIAVPAGNTVLPRPGLPVKTTLPEQIDLDAPNPFKHIPIETSLRPKSRFVDYNLVLKKKTLQEYGAYPFEGVERPLPKTTPAIVLDYTDWLLENVTSTKRTETQILARLLANRNAVKKWYDGQMARAGVLIGSQHHTTFLRTTVIPKELAYNFWDTVGKQSIHLDSLKMLPGFMEHLKMLGTAFWDRSKELLKGAGRGLGWILSYLKWLLVILGGVLIVSMIGMVRVR